MINIKLSNEILRKHKLYIINCNLDERFDIAKKNCEIIKLLPDKIHIKEHYNFCNFIIQEVKKLKDNENPNIFTANVKELNSIIKNLKKNNPSIHKYFTMNTINSKKYRDEILKLIGYEEFSAININDFFKLEKDFYKKYSKNYIKKRLREIKPNMQKFFSNLEYKKICNEILQDINIIEEVNSKNKTYDGNLEKLKKQIIKNSTSKVNLELFTNSLKYFLDEWIKKYDNGYININNYQEYLNRYNNNKVIWSAYSFVFELGIKVCPYCNRQLITPIYSSKSKVRGDLDHFYPKSKYPYLAISIFNLVPCCKFCNSSLKGDKEFSFEDNINPYDEDVDNYLYFSYEPKSINSFYGKDDVVITINDKENADYDIIRKFRNNFEIFQINELYQYNTDIIKTMLKKRIIYSDKYIESFFNKYRNIFKTKKEVIQLLFNESLEYNKDSPFSKLKKDIIEQIIF